MGEGEMYANFIDLKNTFDKENGMMSGYMR